MRYLLPVLLLCLAPATLAQSVPTGTWTGTLQWSNQEPVPLTVEIESCAEGLKLSLTSEDQHYRTEGTVVAVSGPMEFDVTNSARGYLLGCSIDRQDDGTMAGMCTTGSSRARIELTPPDQSIIGCSE